MPSVICHHVAARYRHTPATSFLSFAPLITAAAVFFTVMTRYYAMLSH